MSVRLTTSRLDLAEAIRELTVPDAGAFAVFAGRVRPDRTRAGRVTSLFYEADERMAPGALRSLAAAAGRRSGVRTVVLWHRLGDLPVGEVSVVTGAAADHRAQAFAAARELIERVKSEVPIWKTDRVRPVHRPRRRPSRPAARSRG